MAATPAEIAAAALALLPEALGAACHTDLLLALGRVDQTCRARTHAPLRGRVVACCRPEVDVPRGTEMRALCARQGVVAAGPMPAGSAYTSLDRRPPPLAFQELAEVCGILKRATELSAVSAMAAASRGLWVAAGSYDGNMWLWQIHAPQAPARTWREPSRAPIRAVAWSGGDRALAWLGHDAVVVVRIGAPSDQPPCRLQHPDLALGALPLRAAGQTLRGLGAHYRRWEVDLEPTDAPPGAPLRLKWLDADADGDASRAARLLAQASWVGEAAGWMPGGDDARCPAVADHAGRRVFAYEVGRSGESGRIRCHASDGELLWTVRLTAPRGRCESMRFDATSQCLLLDVDATTDVVAMAAGGPREAWHVEGRALDVAPAGDRVLTVRRSQSTSTPVHGSSSRLDEPLYCHVIQLFTLSYQRGHVLDWHPSDKGRNDDVLGRFGADGTWAVLVSDDSAVVVDLARPVASLLRRVMWAASLVTTFRAPRQAGCTPLALEAVARESDPSARAEA